MEFKHELCQQNNDFFGYTVFTLDFNGQKIRFVTEVDALHIVARHRKADEFVQHIERHLTELELKKLLPFGSKVCCKICGKTIHEIYDDKRRK